MIIFYHDNYKITRIVSTETGIFTCEINQNIVTGLINFAEKFKDDILFWCH